MKTQDKKYRGLIYRAEEGGRTVYVGQTIDFERRIRDHKNESPQKSGWNYYVVECVQGDSERRMKEALSERERFHIGPNGYDTYKNGYNKTPGGRGWRRPSGATKKVSIEEQYRRKRREEREREWERIREIRMKQQEETAAQKEEDAKEDEICFWVMYFFFFVVVLPLATVVF